MAKRGKTGGEKMESTMERTVWDVNVWINMGVKCASFLRAARRAGHGEDRIGSLTGENET